MGFSKRLAAILMAACLSAACLGLAACGGSASSSSASASASGSSASASASESASAAASDSASSASAAASESASAAASESASASSAAPADKFVGTWMIAAAESQGVTMAGDFSELIGVSDSGKLTINADGTGEMALGEESGSFKWTASGDDAIVLTPETDGEASDTTVPVTSKDGALFMNMEQDDQSITVIFTKDGTYAGAKQISMDEATPITSEDELIGTWKMVGMNMMGISIYGDADSLGSLMGDGADATITFEQGGVAKSSSGEESWAIDENGATYTTTGLSGEVTCPVMKLGDEIAIDASEVMGGMELIMVLAK